jgi:hypothetical protein
MNIRIPTGLVIAGGLVTALFAISMFREELPGLIRYLKTEGM